MDNERYNMVSKKRLMDSLKKKFNTTTIGILDILETELGHLWGHGLPYNELTLEQKKFRKKWKQVRTKILDLGNSNLRASQNELSQYSIRWNRYVLNFKVGETNE